MASQGQPPLTTAWAVAKMLTIFALIAWFVGGCGLGYAMLVVLSLEGGSETGHSAEATEITSWWLVGLVVGIVVLRLIVTKGRRRPPAGWTPPPVDPDRPTYWVLPTAASQGRPRFRRIVTRGQRRPPDG